MAAFPGQEKYDPLTYRSGKSAGIRTVFSSNMPHRAPLLFYIAGIEIPITSATVSYGVWKIPECRVTLFPDPLLQRLGAEDRVPVVLFYLDEYLEPERPTWRMLFEGEIVGWGYSNTALGRSIVIDCVADIALYTQLFLYYMSTVAGIVEGVQETGKDGSLITQAVATFPYALFCRGLLPEVGNDKTAQEQIVTRPYDLIYNFIRALTSPKIPDKLRSLPAINFFVRWIRRNQFHNKFVALPFLEEVCDTVGNQTPTPKAVQPVGLAPILRAVRSNFAVKALRDQMAAEASKVAIFGMIKQILDIMQLELAMLPTPAYVKTGLNGEILGPGPTPKNFLGQQLTGAAAAQAANSKAQGLPSTFSTPYFMTPMEPGRLTNYFVKPQCLFSLAPVCNVIFPSMVHQLSYQENYATQPTRLYVEDNELAGVAGGTDKPESLLVNAVTVGYPPAIDKRLQARIVKDPFLTGKNILLYPEEFFKGPVTSVAAAPPWLFYFQAQIQNEPLGPEGLGAPDSKTVSPPKGELSLTEKDLYRLYAQHEYFRQRYEKRGGVIEISGFDPYPVPGFPLVAFDDFQSRLHLVGYLMAVTHAISAGSAATSLSFSYGRTIYEFLTDVANEMDQPQNPDRKNLATAAAPPEPIPEIRDILQHEWRADQFYQRLLWRRTESSAEGSRAQPAPRAYPSVCRIRDLLAFVKPDGTIEPIKIEGTNEETLREQRAALTTQKAALAPLNNDVTLEALARARTGSLQLDPESIKKSFSELRGPLNALDQIEKIAASLYRPALGQAVTDLYEASSQGFLSLKDAVKTLMAEVDAAIAAPPVTSHNLAGAAQRELTPTPGLEPLFDSFDAGMNYGSRPICTLDEYVSFIGGVREGANDEFAYQNGGEIPSARYYTRIRYLKGATPADVATAAQQNLPPDSPATPMGGAGTSSQTGEKVPPAGAVVKNETAGEGVPLTFPMLRAQWDGILLAHRAKIYSTYKLSR
jgi:hypothetical protein